MSTSALSPDFSKPFVFFRKPGTIQIQYWKSHSQAKQKTVTEIILDDNDSWVVGSFLFHEEQKVWTFNADEKMSYSYSPIHDIRIFADSEGLDAPTRVLDTLPKDFKNWVKLATTEMQAGKFSKTALSKVRNKFLSPEFNWWDWFQQACEKFPNALVFFIHIPGVRTWAGSTPELLLSASDHIVKSVALAGTLHPDSKEGWSDKEREEQLFVTQYIKDVFIESGFENVTVSSPETITIGKLSHLKTSFQASYTSENQLSEFIFRLHPTPAVGGLPKKEGVQFILDHEPHHREWYSGFIGTINKENMELYVNLRSMQVAKNNALLYAGAGITASSNADLEWLETENKLNMNLDILK